MCLFDDTLSVLIDVHYISEPSCELMNLYALKTANSMLKIWHQINAFKTQVVSVAVCSKVAVLLL